MSITVILFWISLAVLFFCYAGYGMLLIVVNAIRHFWSSTGGSQESPELPVTLIVPAYNEGKVIEQKIKNCLALVYPPGKLTIIFVTDGSTDDTASILARYPAVCALHNEDRQGKMAAI